MTMQEYYLESQVGRDLKFTGRLLASVKDEYKLMELYFTKGGKYVCFIKNLSDSMTSFLHLDDTLVTFRKDEVIGYFGYSPEAKKLYKEADIQFYLEVD